VGGFSENLAFGILLKFVDKFEAIKSEGSDGHLFMNTDVRSGVWLGWGEYCGHRGQQSQRGGNVNILSGKIESLLSTNCSLQTFSDLFL
jgi:hypothetical protein